MSKYLRATFMVLSDCIEFVFTIIVLLVSLMWAVFSALHVVGMLGNYMIGGRLLTISESDDLGYQAIGYETMFFYVALLFWVGVGVYFFCRAMKEKMNLITQ